MVEISKKSPIKAAIKVKTMPRKEDISPRPLYDMYHIAKITDSTKSAVHKRKNINIRFFSGARKLIKHFSCFNGIA
jgi:hypothetical protein